MRNSDRLPAGKQENYIEQAYRLKQEAKVLAEKFKDIKPQTKIITCLVLIYVFLVSLLILIIIK